MSSLRRLAKDHAQLRASLPPNYLFPHSADPIFNSLSDDLTNLIIYMTGPISTPYTSGLFLLHLRIPPSFPANPPTATFRTKIFHPNVDDKTGAVCLETLKRDWDSKLTLKDILVHISCLLLQPNPDSALNENAGVLVREDYDGFERKAKLMTKIHASTPNDYESAALEARTRGEEQRQESSLAAMTQTKENRMVDGKAKSAEGRIAWDSLSKENNLAQEPRCTKQVINEPILGKRAASSHSGSHEEVQWQALNGGSVLRNQETGEPLRKSPKHDARADTSGELVEEYANAAGQDNIEIHEVDLIKHDRRDEPQTTGAGATLRPLALRRISNVGPGKLRPYARIGIRRL